MLKTNSDVEIDLTGGNWYNSSALLDDRDHIDSSMAKNTQKAIQAYQYIHSGTNFPIASIIEEAIGS